MKLTSDELIERIRAVADEIGTDRLTQAAFSKATGISGSQVLGLFDSWSEACAAAGVRCGPTGRENLKPNPRIDEEACIKEMQRIARLVDTDVLTKAVFDKHAKFTTFTVLHRFGSWKRALEIAGLQRSDNLREEIPLAVLAEDFLRVTLELKRIPTVHQLVRRSVHGLNSFTRKFNGFANFKREASRHLLTGKYSIPEDICSLLKKELGTEDINTSGDAPRAFEKGAVLGFRAFAYAPTYEQEVVSLFSAVAHDLGFEIVTMRPAFPDCLARRLKSGRRKRYIDCRIEFELRSKDFEVHGHSKTGCDLIVCWEANWPKAPIEVLALKDAIRKLDGWK